MKSLPQLSMLRFNKDTIDFVRKEINLENQDRVDEAVRILDEWVRKQNHFMKKDFAPEFLERTLVMSKGLIEKGKKIIENYCLNRTLFPQYYDHEDIHHNYEILKKYVTHAHLPNMTPDHCRVYISKLLSTQGDPSYTTKYFKYILALSEYLRKNEYCNGFIMIMDLTDVSIANILPKLNMMELRQTSAILSGGYGMRIRGVHYITSSKLVDSLIGILKSFANEKVGNRIHVHKTMDSLHELVPKDTLPAEYGGKERSLLEIQDEWFKVVTSKEHKEYLNEMQKAKINESHRPIEKLNHDYLEMAGSFRTLTVD